jgi:Ricin-type beta-trefoil lectin domain-like
MSQDTASASTNTTRGDPATARPVPRSLGKLCQEWNVTPAGSRDTISNVANGVVLDAEDCETANGTTVRQWAQLDNTCQQ